MHWRFPGATTIVYYFQLLKKSRFHAGSASKYLQKQAIIFTYTTSFLDRFFFFHSEMLIVIVSCGKEPSYGGTVTSC